MNSMVIFHSYVGLPEGFHSYISSAPMMLTVPCYPSQLLVTAAAPPQCLATSSAPLGFNVQVASVKRTLEMIMSYTMIS